MTADMTIAKIIARWLLVVAFVIAGWNHFRDPDLYLAMMPPYLPWPAGLIAISGVAEIAGGIGVAIPAVRRLAGWGLIALLVAVFPANLHMALNHVQLPGVHLSETVLWIRLPLQAVLILWVWWVALSGSAHGERVKDNAATAGGR
jgi:uncharacterized membrane protein